MSLRGRPVATAALLYALLAVVAFVAALVPGKTLSASDYLWSAAPFESERPANVRPLGSNYELVDSTTQFQPWVQHSRERAPHAPLWNPHVGAGRPFLANAQSAWLSPFSLPSYLLPFWWSLGLVAALKVFAAAFGTYLLARALALRQGGALLAGVVYALCLYMVVWISWPQAGVWALLPWLFLLAEKVIRRPNPAWSAGLAAVVALQFFGGHPESSFHVLLATAAFFGLRLVVLRREGALDSPWRPVLALGAGLAGGAALAAVVLVPFLELLLRSGDVDSRQTFYELSLPRRYLLGFALPDYWGRATHAAYGAFAQERALYVGALPLVLAAVGLAVRPTVTRVGVAVIGVLALALALGLPPLPQIAGQLPIVKTGNHLRVVVILMLCLALLAGWGLDELASRRIERRRAVLALAGGLLVLPVLVLGARGQISLGALGAAVKLFLGSGWPDGAPTPEQRAVIRLAALVGWLVFMGSGLALIAWRLSGRLGTVAFVALAVALVAVDLLKTGMGANPAIPTSHAVQSPAAAIDYLRSRRPNRFVGLERALGPSPLIPNLALRWKLYDARSYDLPVERRLDRLWRRAIHDGPPTETPTTKARLTARALPAYRLLSVTDIAQDPAERPVRKPALAVAYGGRDLRVYRNPGALPRAGVVGSQRVVPGDEGQLSAVLDPAFDGRHTVVTPESLSGLANAPVRRPAGSARIVGQADERMSVRASARRPAALVLTDLHYPGWKAEVDGRPAELHRVNYLLRGLALPPGRHRVELRYEPGSFLAGRLVSLVALLALAAALAPTLTRRWRAA